MKKLILAAAVAMAVPTLAFAEFPIGSGQVDELHVGSVATQFRSGITWYGIQLRDTDTTRQAFQKVMQGMFLIDNLHKKVGFTPTGKTVLCNPGVCPGGVANEVTNLESDPVEP